jgi:CTP:molybdopterin cytidylyltransferase MocA
VAAVVLAAGLGRRFGGPKAHATLAGESLLDRAVSLAVRCGLDPVIAVVPPDVGAPAGAVAVANPYPERGLSSSLQLGIVAVPAGRAALVLLVDQPTLDPATVAAVLAARGPRPFVAATAGGRLGPPVLVEPAAFPMVMALSGDIGLRDVFTARPEEVTAVPVRVHPPDVDTADDLAQLEAEARLGS